MGSNTTSRAVFTGAPTAVTCHAATQARTPAVLLSSCILKMTSGIFAKTITHLSVTFSLVKMHLHLCQLDTRARRTMSDAAVMWAPWFGTTKAVVATAQATRNHDAHASCMNLNQILRTPCTTGRHLNYD